MDQRTGRSGGEPKTRIQRANEERILEAALDVFSTDGFRGATVDRIAEAAGMSKPNLLYYFRTKEAVYRALLERLLDAWLEPLGALDPAGEPQAEIARYLGRKLEMARDYPRESRLFAGEMLRGAPVMGETLAGPLRALVDEKAAVIRGWIDEGRLAAHDPRHLIFAIWATTQHYADFDVQVRAVLGEDADGRFDEAARFLKRLFAGGLKPRG
ncbi:MAG TPA: TetR family transcriptional regulator C-terminal domain-containing protein [Thermohalobaculum sp.]|nr:TetR family transcriptional regulator C-terminal domain-containing protein [Thermohalobaculum sp.]